VVACWTNIFALHIMSTVQERYVVRAVRSVRPISRIWGEALSGIQDLFRVVIWTSKESGKVDFRTASYYLFCNVSKPSVWCSLLKLRTSSASSIAQWLIVNISVTSRGHGYPKGVSQWKNVGGCMYKYAVFDIKLAYNH